MTISQEPLQQQRFTAKAESEFGRIAGTGPHTKDQFAVADPVWIEFRSERIAGHIAEKHTKYGLVVTEDGREFRAPWQLVIPRSGAGRKRVTTRTNASKARFQAGDIVEFTNKDDDVLRGTITRLNPKRAFVAISGQAGGWRVPYSMLTKVSADDGGDQIEQLRAVAAKADRLISEHGLTGWSFQFDDAATRAGCCRYDVKVISMARQYCLEAGEQEWTDTILHEIAHALVGPDHHHDDIWKHTARMIGCTAERCHDRTFAPSRYIVFCSRCKWAGQRNKRSRGLVCRNCSEKVDYQIFTRKRWEEFGKEYRLE